MRRSLFLSLSHFHSLPLVLMSLLALSACGGGGSSGEGDGSATNSGLVNLGTVVMPGITLTVTRTSPLVPGASATFRVTSADPGIASGRCKTPP